MGNSESYGKVKNYLKYLAGCRIIRNFAPCEYMVAKYHLYNTLQTAKFLLIIKHIKVK